MRHDKSPIDLLVLLTALACAPARGQEPQATTRSFGILSNHRAVAPGTVVEPLTVRKKFVLGAREACDPSLFLLSGMGAALSQWADVNPGLGQGMKGLGRRYVRSVADSATAKFLSRGVLPSALGEDPRYYVRGPAGGTAWQRVRYALTRIVVTRTDAGSSRFNYSEILGGAGSAAISNLYYPQSRTALGNTRRFALKLAADAAANVLQELWPDIRRRLSRKKPVRP